MSARALQARGPQRQSVGFLAEVEAGTIVAAPPTIIRGHITSLLLLALALFGGIGTWAAIGSINSAVVANGTFEIEGDKQIVQHLEGGMVRQIHVAEGQDVAQGDPLITLDDTRLSAQISVLETQLAAALARDARLAAEQEDRDSIAQSPELAELIGRVPALATIVATQEELLRSNRATDAGRVAILTERRGQIASQLSGTEQRLAALNSQLTLIRDEREVVGGLLDQGLTTRNRFVALRQDEIELGGDVAQAEREADGLRQQLIETDERIFQIRRDRQTEISDTRQQLREQLLDLNERLEATRDIAGRLVVRAPVSGQIVGFDINTLGAVIAPGQEIMGIVPESRNYIVEARVGPGDIDEVRLDSPARVRLLAYSFRKTPPLNGRVTQISADAFADEDTAQSYYKIRVAIPAREFESLPDVRAIPSMPVQVLVATGEQTILTYLLDPVLGGLEKAMIENE